MEPTKRIIVNTVAQYSKAVFTTVLALFSTRLVLSALQVSDYGLYAVVGGVVALLGFITGALIVTTQRYISYYFGVGDTALVRRYFVSSLLLHLAIGLFLAAVLMALRGWLVGSFLNIDPGRTATASVVYAVTVAMLLLTVATAPFKALFIARENIVFVAAVDTLDAVVKLLLAVVLLYVSADKLLVYALMMASVLVLNLLIYVGYAVSHFAECTLRVRRSDVSRQCLSALVGFAGWTTFGMGATAARTQGFAIIFNRFLGTAVNAAYGIALQVFGAVCVIVTSILNAMNPQIMKAEGGGDRQRMLLLALGECKYSTALLALFTVPLIAEMPSVLSFWLGEVPPSTSLFCRFILTAFICDQVTMGLHSAIQATGRLAGYSLLVFTPKILNLPVAWFMLRAGLSPLAVMAVYLGIEAGVALLRLPLARYFTGLSPVRFVAAVVVPLLPLLAVAVAVSWGLTVVLPPWPFRFVLTFVVAVVATLPVAWRFTLDAAEHAYVVNLINRHRPCR